MNAARTVLRISLIFSIALALSIVAEDAKAPAKILYFTKSARFEHTVIAQKNGAPSFSETILNDLGKKNNFTITTTKDGGAMTAENLAKYDAIMFYTSGDLTIEKAKDGSPPMTKEGKAALIEAVKNGKPFICVHNALKTFDGGKEIDPYVEMLGGEGIGHGAIQPGKNSCVDPKFPGAAELKDGLAITEEWYSNKNFAKDIHVILVQEPAGMNGGVYNRPPYPATWARMFGKGRVFVTGLGHREDVWTNPLFQSLLVGGIQWALGRAEADITPNIETATPQYAQLPAPEKK
jgi:type 1 glutamine amidotransferase